ncbi:septal ring lytic transglycosylase RlpA family protein [Flavobacterium sp. MFBS3-15]|uniref:septal ring lytic transglycosylase RlpA family protein n=1 Tax=Flavobacterium sp. MFBS3-15 TaxID=2989816 RepID=UPI002235B818|nr:septal ring lytic transglycosylase RlpA family protein [Flavobacterium sp. MFBS3-15]MCW4470023.1 septal ring lytic transglycosylase RlpA family protein [Flavobacterium sp. MFBS3-15]
MKNSSLIFSAALLFLIITGFATTETVAVRKIEKPAAAIVADTTEVTAPIAEKPAGPKLTLYKKSALATYYADKFNGRKTSSGERFHNKHYTAAHMKLPFGTMVRVTNEANGKFVDVKVNDRGPYSKKLEIDLTRTAFMEIASNKKSGTFKVKMEIIEKK